MTGSRVLLAALCGLALAGLPEWPRAAAEGSRAESAAPKRIWADSPSAWIYAEPRLTPNGVGYLRAGGSVALKTGEPVDGPGCARGWYAVEPHGYICDDRRTALKPTRYVESMQLARPTERPLPYEYALSNHAPMYRRLPSPAEWQHHERTLGEAGSFKPLSWGNRGHELLAEVRAIPATGGIPDFFADGGSVSRRTVEQPLRRMMPLGSMLAYTRSFEHQGRTWLFSADGTLVPADRVRPFRASHFRGVQLSRESTLPLAWIRSESERRWIRGEDAAFTAAREPWPLRSAVRLAAGAQPVSFRGHRYWPSRERDAAGRVQYVREGDASVVTPRDKLPWGIAADQKWLSISITRGVLVAYRGLTPIFTTLISPGAGGVPIEGRDPVRYSTTPTGRYRVTFKHLAADMSPDHGEDRRFWIADVPYTLYFSPPFAIHVAYWHEDFGHPMSAGCVNVSPEDGKWLFEWTDPPLPQAWHGVAASRFSGQGTVIIITR